MENTVLDLLKRLDIPYRWTDHPAVFTVAESVKHIEDKRPIKNLLLQERDGSRKFLIIMDGEKRLDTKQITDQLGTRKLRFASPEVLLDALGVTPGAVSVFGLLHPGAKAVEVVIDQSLLEETELGFHPNYNTATIFITGSNLEKIIKATGHSYNILKLQ